MRTCLVCQSPMKIIHNFDTKKAKRSGNKFRVRRAGCTVCDYTELVTGDSGDYEERVENSAVEAASKL